MVHFIPLNPNSLQNRIRTWMCACFGAEIARNRRERTHRFLEEALKLAQAEDCTEAEAMTLVKYVFSRPKGETAQEIGGVIITLHALGDAADINVRGAGKLELERVWGLIKEIRAKQKAKRDLHGALP